MDLTRIRLEYVVTWPNHAGLFVARKKGWYQEAGLDVDISWDGFDRGTPAQLAAKGEFQFASIRLGELLETRHSDHPFVAVATFNQNQLGGVITLKEKRISRFRDLEGKTVSIPPVKRLIQMVIEAVEKDGGDFSKVKVMDPGVFEPDIRAVEKGKYDAIFNVLGWEAYQGSKPFSEVVQLSFDEVEVTPHHAYFLCVEESYLRSHEDQVRAFLAATSRGYDFARDNQAETVDILASTMCASEADVLEASLKFMAPSWHAPSRRWGEMDAEIVRSYTTWMSEHGFTTASLADVEGAYTNDYLPEK